MSGHNKWSKIKRAKAANDAKRSKIFSRILKEITIAVKEGGSGDPALNPRLRLAITNGKSVNLPKDNVERAIKKATEGGGASLAEITYEGYAPGGVAVFVEAATDNTNRTVMHVRSIFNKYGGNLATNGSVDFLFERRGAFIFPQGAWNEDDLTLELIDAGAIDVELYEGEWHVSTALKDYGLMQKKLESLNIEATNVELQRIPLSPVETDIHTAKSVLHLVEILEEDEDVMAVYHNMLLTEEIMAEI
jgi:YebC/PmpR family DNA-binding regulatory protein